MALSVSPVSSHLLARLGQIVLSSSPSKQSNLLWLNNSVHVSGRLFVVDAVVVENVSSNTTWYCGEQSPVLGFRTIGTVCAWRGLWPK
jgi:hypothetical protein